MNGPPTRGEGAPRQEGALVQSCEAAHSEYGVTQAQPSSVSAEPDHIGLLPDEHIVSTINAGSEWSVRWVIGRDRQGRDTWTRDPIAAFVLVDSPRGRRIEALIPEFDAPGLRTVTEMADSEGRTPGEYELVRRGQCICECAPSWNDPARNWCSKCGSDVVAGGSE